MDNDPAGTSGRLRAWSAPCWLPNPYINLLTMVAYVKQSKLEATVLVPWGVARA
jgi:hypothetical protein